MILESNLGFHELVDLLLDADGKHGEVGGLLFLIYLCMVAPLEDWLAAQIHSA